MTFESVWKLLAGLGIFLYGMFLLEDTLKQLAGRTFKLFLRKHTDNKLSAILSGTLVTGFLQSSSVVTFMALSFVGAGVISMRNALAVVFGSNLGTTLSNWIVVTLGFKFDIESFSFPIIAIAGIGLIAFKQRKKIYQVFLFGLGFGLLFLGLGIMKGSIDVLVNNIDLSAYAHLNSLSFVFIGFIITAIIQSSSAAMVITLSALNAGAISFEIAVPVVIGSELGTSVKTLLGSLGGIAAKKRVAFGNILFNVVITIFAFFLMQPLIVLVKYIIGANEPLIGLVLFQTIVNLSGIILFFPFLNHFGNFLENRFEENEERATYFIQNINPALPETIIEIMEKETLLFIQRVIHLNMEAFHIGNTIFNNDNYFKNVFLPRNNKFKSYFEKYDNVKHAEGEILSLYIRLSEEKIEREDFLRLNQLISSVRNAMYSAKGIKDIRRDRRELRDSAIDSKYEQYKFIQSQLYDFYIMLERLLENTEKSSRFEELVRIMRQIQKDYEIRTNNIYIQSARKTIGELDISTLLNLNREVYSSCKAIVTSFKEYLLDKGSAENFDNIPFFNNTILKSKEN